ncbi:uncharacterized protein IWZ02DRAFT_190607 [Phyllosticta citriasiana]|uniref:uncharacterized protein n=1 Tax=Phyllosticta citriasiana TaxID=595635 RepID=UPI0030FD22DA
MIVALLHAPLYFMWIVILCQGWEIPCPLQIPLCNKSQRDVGIWILLFSTCPVNLSMHPVSEVGATTHRSRTAENRFLVGGYGAVCVGCVLGHLVGGRVGRSCGGEGD